MLIFLQYTGSKYKKKGSIMARLPQPGGDQGAWGSILNEFLTTTLNTDGTLKANSVTTSTVADGSITGAKLSTSAAPQAGQVLSWNGTRLNWTNQPNISVVTDSQWQTIQPGVNGVLYVVVPG
jgi:hypothetical protein